MSNDSKDLQDHESALRKLMSNAHGTPYSAIPSLEEASKIKNAYLIMEGDEGGQIYLVAPVSIIKCDQQILVSLLKELDDRKWKDISMAGLYFEAHEPGSTISGGMGGGMAEKDLWIHNNFEDIKDKIQSVINGSAKSINS